MKKFSLIKEQNEILDSLTNKHIKLKELLLENIEFDDVNDLLTQLDMGIESLKNDGKNIIMNLQTFDDKIKFLTENNDSISNVLNETQWFSTPSNRLNISNIQQYLDKAIDTMTLNVLELIKSEITK